MFTSNYYTDIAEKGVEISRLRNMLYFLEDIAYYDKDNRRIIIKEKDLNANKQGREFLEYIKNKDKENEN